MKREITDKFKKITGYDIQSFLSDYVYFINNYYKDVIAYYKDGADANGQAFDYLENLLTESAAIESVIIANTNVFDNAEYWDLIDTFSSIQTSLNTISNLGRWLRSSRTDRFSGSVKLPYVQKQVESLEDISKRTGSIDSENDLSKLALMNDLNEESYTSAGGAIMSIDMSNNMTFEIKNIVDNLIGDAIYGKDIQKYLQLVDGDYIVLEGLDSLMQSFGTILDTFKGSIPEFPEDGVDQEVIGSNLNTVNYPSIFRSLLSMFRKDDRFSAVSLMDLYREDDSVFMKLQASTKTGDKLLKDIQL